jgi:DNA-binding transcriptional regulator GbsR (MarR family)
MSKRSKNYSDNLTKFAQIPNEVFLLAISANAVRVLGYLMSIAWQGKNNPGQRLLAKLLRMNRMQVNRAIKELTDLNIVEIKNGKGELGVRHYYEVNPPEEWDTRPDSGNGVAVEDSEEASVPKANIESEAAVEEEYTETDNDGEPNAKELLRKLEDKSARARQGNEPEEYTHQEFCECPIVNETNLQDGDTCPDCKGYFSEVKF